MIESTQTKVSYKIGNNTVFPFPFKFFEPEDIKVKVNGNLIKQGVDYNVERKESYQNGSNVILKSVYDSKADIVIYRELPIKQLTDLPEFGKLSAEAIENEFDRIIMICQELAEKLKRALLSDGEFVFSLEDILKDIELIRIFAADLSSVSDSATRAAVSAAQALISAIEARQYRDAAKELTDFAISLSDITLHNQYTESHPYILNLVKELRTLLNAYTTDYLKHIKDYDTFKEDNSDEHKNFENFNSKISERLNKLESNSTAVVNNRFFTFGLNNYAQLGVNLNVTVNTAPVEHTGMRNVSKVATSQTCGAAIAGGRLYVTGLGGNGFCGSKLTQNFAFAPHDCVDSIYGWTDVAVFNEVGMAIRDGKLYSWGNGNLGCLGDGTIVTRAVPREIVIPDEKFVSVAAGPCVFLALTESGRIYSCGASLFGALGHAQEYEVNNNMTLIPSLENVVQIAAGGLHGDKYYNFCAAIKKNKDGQAQLYVWGWNGAGNLGMNNYINLSAPTIVNLPFTPQKVSCGLYHMAILSTDGKIYLAGHQAVFGQQGDQLTFKAIESDDIYVDVAAGVQVTYMLTSYKHLYGQGESAYGSLLGQQSSGVPVELQQGNIEKIFCNSQQYGCAFTVAEETDNA